MSEALPPPGAQGLIGVLAVGLIVNRSSLKPTGSNSWDRVKTDEVGVLIDTSVWVEHCRRRNYALVHQILSDQALTQPMVLVELACGTPINQFLKITQPIPPSSQAQALAPC